MVVNTLAIRAAALALTVLELGISLPSAALAAPLTLQSAGTGTTRVLIGTASSTAFTGVGSVLSPLYDYPVLANSLPGGNNNFVSGALAPYAGNYYFGATSAVVTVRYGAAIAAGSVSGAFTVTAGNAVIGDPTVTGTTSTSAPATLTASAGNALICVGGNLATVPSNGSGIAAGATPTQIVVTANASAGPKAAAPGGAALGTSVPGLPIGCGDTRKLQVFTENVSGGSVVDTILVAVNHTLQGVTTPNTFTVAQGSGTQLTTRAVTKTALATPASTLTGVVNPTTNSAFAVSITPGAFAPGTNDTASTNFVLTSTSAAAGGLYSDVWDPTTGNLALVHAISASFFPSQLLVADGAAPALVAVRRIMTGPDFGRYRPSV